MVATPDSPHPTKLLEQVRDRLRVKHYSIRTETQYIHFIVPTRRVVTLVFRAAVLRLLRDLT
jgi:hypothetical protein